MTGPGPIGGASDALRSELIFLPADGRVVPVDGGFALLSPSSPGYWWGNSLHFDRPPGPDDFARWTTLFERTVRILVPAAKHATFAWDGGVGVVEPFVAAGFVFRETTFLGLDRGGAVVAPHPVEAAVERVTDRHWDAAAALLATLRNPLQSREDHAAFVAGRIAGWRRLADRGQGAFFCVCVEARAVSLLGVFAEAERGIDGRRIGRYQEVITDPGWRRRGLAGTLIAHAARHAFDALRVDTLLIEAEAGSAPERLYRACGFRFRSNENGLERGG